MVIPKDIVDPVSEDVPENIEAVVEVPEMVPEVPVEMDHAQNIIDQASVLRESRLAHEDASTRQRKADMAVEEVDSRRVQAMSDQEQAVAYVSQSRDDVVDAYDGLIGAVRAAKDAFLNA